MNSINIQGFDFEEFLNTDVHNREVSIKLLKEKDYWKHFNILTDIYGNFHDSFSPSFLKTHSGMSKKFLFGGCLVNLVKGISFLLAGHLTDSHIYGRRTIEAQKIALYLREHPEQAEEWFKTREQASAKKFKEKVVKWFKKTEGSLFKSEFPGSNVAMKTANHVGPHTDFTLLLFQNKIEKKDNKHIAKIVFHELDEGVQGQVFLIDRYFWHLNIHFWTVFWWMEKSGLENALKKELKKFWDECRLDFERTLANSMKESNKIWPIRS